MQQRLARGEAAALGELYDRFASLVHSLAHRVLSDEDAADQITREVFGYVWENPDAYDPKLGSMRSWVAKLTQRQAVQRLRQAEASSYAANGGVLDGGAGAEGAARLGGGPRRLHRDLDARARCVPPSSWPISSAATTGRPPPISASPRTRRAGACGSACNCSPPPTLRPPEGAAPPGYGRAL